MRAQSGSADSGIRSAGAPLYFRANVHAVIVDVVVTKGRDETVPSLQKQDFEIKEDGNPQTIDFFEEHAPAPDSAAPAPALPPNTFTNQPSTLPGDEVTVLLLDKLNTPAEDQGVFLEGVRGFLRGLQPGKRVAIFALTSRLRLLQGFAGDPAKLQAAMSGKGAAAPGTTVIAHTAQDDAMDQMQAASLAESLGIRDNSVAPMNQLRANERSTLTLQALNALSRYLAGIPGRKNLIWYASDFPLAIFPDDRIGQTLAQNQAVGSEVRTTIGLLTAARVAVYPVSAQGVANDQWTQASDRSEASGDMQQQAATEQSARSADVAAMEQIAGDTGGRAIYTTNNLGKATADAMQNGAHYYTLAYTPTNTAMDGRYRRIEVKLAHGKYSLAYRRGYFADDAATSQSAASDPLIPLLTNGMPSATQILYRVRALPASPQPAQNASRAGGNQKLAGPLTRYLVELDITANDLDIEPTSEGARIGKIDVALAAYDRNGAAVNWTGGASTITLNAASYAAAQHSGIPLRLQIDLPDTPLALATGVYDLTSRKAGTLEIPVPPAREAGEAAAH